MLGLRRYRGVQIDLFLGEHELFHCEYFVRSPNDLNTGGQPPSGSDQMGLYRQALKNAEPSNHRHVALVNFGSSFPDQDLSSQAKTALLSVKEYLDKDYLGPGNGLGRISFVLSTKVEHDAFQDALFEAFSAEVGK